MSAVNQLGKYQPYPDYKDSGVEWLGYIPKEWLPTRLKYISHVNMGQSPNSEDCNDVGNGVPFLQGNAEFGRKTPSPKQFCEVAKKNAKPGDFLFSVRAPVGAVNIANQLYGIGRGLCAIRPSSDVINEYLWWVLQISKVQFDAISTGSTFEAVSAEQVNNFSLALPSRAEQKIIATFLDYETARIDQLIARQKQLIELLKEKRQAVISHAVTKGLNPNAPMKDSGVEWLGQVPEHWDVLKMKHLLQFVTSGSRGWAEFYSDSGALFFRIANLTRDTIRPKLDSIQNVSPPDNSEGERSRINEGDILISITADLGSVCVADKSIAGGYVSQHVSLSRPKTSILSSDWLAYFVLADTAKEQLLGSGYGGTKVQLSLEDIRDLTVCVPNKYEQTQIADFLNERSKQFEQLINRATSLISYLQERRTALISAAVTGKIDLRGWQPPKCEVAA